MRLNRILAGVLSAAIALPVLATGFSIPVYAAEGVTIDSTNFPDTNFCNYVKNFDTDSNGVLDSSEISKVTSINVSLSDGKISDGIGPGSADIDYRNVKNIKNIKGIEFFTNLEKLDISYNKSIADVDLSNNTKLTKLNIHNTAIKSLNLFKLTNLTELRAWNTKLTSINITNNPNLYYLDVCYTEISTINVSNNPKLRDFANSTPSNKTWLNAEYHSYNDGTSTINCNTDTIISVDVKDGVALTEENFGDINFCNYLANKLDANGDGILSKEEAKAKSLYDLPALHYSVIKGLSYIDGLEIFDVSSIETPQIDELDLSNCSSLVTMDFRGCGISKLNLANCTALKKIDINSNNISSFDFSPFTELTELWIRNNKFTSLDLSNNSNLRQLYCSNNLLSSIDVSHCPKLRRLYIESNPISTVDLSAVNLTQFSCCDTKITNLDLSKQTDLYVLEITKCDIKNIDLSNNTQLDRLDCDLTLIETLDLTPCKYISSLSCVTKSLKVLDIRKYPRLLSSYNNVSREAVLYNMPCIEYGYFPSYSDDIRNLEVRLTVLPDTYIIAKDEDVANAPTPTPMPTSTPSKTPTSAPTAVPGGKPTTAPTNAPVAKPTVAPGTTVAPTTKPGVTTSPGTTNVPNKPGSTTTSPSVPTATSTPKPSKPQTGVSDKSGTVEDFAERLYTTCLGREAEKAGKDYWVGELKAGKPGSEVAQGFFFSPEFTGLNLSNEEYITRLYRTFMGREPDQDGMNYWLCEMKNGQDRVFVFDGFVNSQEWADICLTYGIRSGGLAEPTFEKQASDKVKAFAERLYTTCLGRDAEPEGLKYWSQELANLRQTGTVAASGFFNSPEFISLNTSNEEYITRLYRTFMGREPEKAGFDYWMSELKSGKDRQFVFDGFSVAPEFANLCAEAGIMR